MTTSFRDYESRDLDGVLALNMHAQDPRADIAASLRHYPRLLDIPAEFQRLGAFLVGERDGAIIAMSSIEPTPDPAEYEVDYIRVAIPSQRQGVATELMGLLEERIRGRGGDVAMLNVSADNTGARRLYESIGYRETGSRVVYNADGVAFYPVTYTKRLG